MSGGVVCSQLFCATFLVHKNVGTTRITFGVRLSGSHWSLFLFNDDDTTRHAFTTYFTIQDSPPGWG